MSEKNKDARRKSPRVPTDGLSPGPAKKKTSKKAVKAGKVSKTVKTVKASKASKANLDKLGELPRSHGADRIFLIARDPHRLYSYWDIDISRHPGGPTYLRAFVGSEESPESELPVTFESRNHELPARQAGSRYRVELGYFRGATWHCLARSATVETPPDHISDTTGTTFTTVSWPTEPSSSRGSQDSGSAASPSLIDLPEQHRRILAMLLGTDLLTELSSASFSSEEISSRIHLHLEELLSSGSASELLARIPGALAAISGSSEHSANLPTLTAAQLTQWTRETLSSFAPETSWSSWLSSWASSGPEASSFQVSSWTEGPGSHFLSSWMSGMSGSSSELSHLSGLSSLSSWGGHSENLSSPGFLNDETLQLRADIFLEGRTRPGARLSINGHSVPVHPDGSFRHHFSFGDSDGSSEVTIVTSAPDEMEARRTTLRLDQKTDLVPEAGTRSTAA